jgi:hypothetical protein
MASITGQEMRPFESKTHSFIVKIWLEETIVAEGQSKWRGHITHVPDGERHYIESVEAIPAFVGRYLEASPMKVKRLGRLRRWLSSDRWKQERSLDYECGCRGGRFAERIRDHVREE